MNDQCQHPILKQTSEVMMTWTWSITQDGTYSPGVTHDKILHEETIDFTCIDCGEEVHLGDDLRIEVWD